MSDEFDLVKLMEERNEKSKTHHEVTVWVPRLENGDEFDDDYDAAKERVEEALQIAEAVRRLPVGWEIERPNAVQWWAVRHGASPRPCVGPATSLPELVAAILADEKRFPPNPSNE